MTRGIIADPRTRRWTMFILLAAALLMLFAGATFLAGAIESPWTFLLYWFVCAWLTLAALLLALLDILMVRVIARRERRRLEEEMKGKHEPR
ncbi:MAG TPA: hypothetical protein VHY22_14625 [Chthoniobacteraceae bacterium]|nr:hypothetical protein [Chthoniobacteraceae bacterium]